MNLRECDQGSADLVRAYATASDGNKETPEAAIVIRTYGNGNVRVICPEGIDPVTLSAYLNQAADLFFDGQGVASRIVE